MWCLVTRRLCWGPAELTIPLAMVFNLLAIVVTMHMVRQGLAVELNPLLEIRNPTRAYATSLGLIFGSSLIIAFLTRGKPEIRLLLLSLLLGVTAADFSHDAIFALTYSPFLALHTLGVVAASIPSFTAVYLLKRRRGAEVVA